MLCYLLKVVEGPCDWPVIADLALDDSGVGTPIDPEDLPRLKVWCTFHDLRHTGCMRILEAGAPFPLIARIIGWSIERQAHLRKDIDRKSSGDLSEEKPGGR